MSSEGSHVAAMLGRLAKKEQDDLDRAHGEQILAAVDAAKERQERREDPLVQVLRLAHQAKVEADKE
jgi:hypothetical protein